MNLPQYSDCSLCSLAEFDTKSWCPIHGQILLPVEREPFKPNEVLTAAKLNGEFNNLRTAIKRLSR